MYSIIPVHEDRAGAIITLVGLGHERRGYAGRLVYARAWGSSRLCQIGYCHPHPYEPSHANPIVQFSTLSRGNVQIAESSGLLPH
jgi:hypothetical protein